jgi:hypothetical protein
MQVITSFRHFAPLVHRRSADDDKLSGNKMPEAAFQGTLPIGFKESLKESLHATSQDCRSIASHPVFISSACARDGTVARAPRSQPCRRSR